MKSVFSRMNMIMGNEIAAIIEEIETILVDAKHIANTAKVIPADAGCKASNRPNIDATPFPPLNPE